MAGEMPDDRRARPMAGSMLDCHHDISALFQLNWRKRGPFEGYTKRPYPQRRIATGMRHGVMDSSHF